MVRQQDGKSRGFGFVEFETSGQAKKAIAANGKEFDGRAISVDFSGGKPMGNDRAGAPGGRPAFGGSAGGAGSTTLFVGNLGFKTTEDTL